MNKLFQLAIVTICTFSVHGMMSHQWIRMQLPRIQRLLDQKGKIQLRISQEREKLAKALEDKQILEQRNIDRVKEYFQLLRQNALYKAKLEQMKFDNDSESIAKIAVSKPWAQWTIIERIEFMTFFRKYLSIDISCELCTEAIAAYSLQNKNTLDELLQVLQASQTPEGSNSTFDPFTILAGIL